MPLPIRELEVSDATVQVFESRTEEWSFSMSCLDISATGNEPNAVVSNVVAGVTSELGGRILEWKPLENVSGVEVLIESAERQMVLRVGVVGERVYIALAGPVSNLPDSVLRAFLDSTRIQALAPTVRAARE